VPGRGAVDTISQLNAERLSAFMPHRRG